MTDCVKKDELLETALWELRKVVLAYEAWVRSNLRSPAKAMEVGVAIASAKKLLEEHGRLHLAGMK